MGSVKQDLMPKTSQTLKQWMQILKVGREVGRRLTRAEKAASVSGLRDERERSR